MPEGTFEIVETEHHGKLGFILGLLILALVLILAGLYLWYVNVFQTAPTPEPIEQTRIIPEMPEDPETANADAAVQQLNTVSPANDLGSITADIEATNLDSLDAELPAIDAELGLPPAEVAPLDNTTETSGEDTQTDSATIEADAAAETEAAPEEVTDSETTTEEAIVE